MFSRTHEQNAQHDNLVAPHAADLAPPPSQRPPKPIPKTLPRRAAPEPIVRPGRGRREGVRGGGSGRERVEGRGSRAAVPGRGWTSILGPNIMNHYVHDRSSRWSQLLAHHSRLMHFINGNISYHRGSLTCIIYIYIYIQRLAPHRRPPITTKGRGHAGGRRRGKKEVGVDRSANIDCSY